MEFLYLRDVFFLGSRETGRVRRLHGECAACAYGPRYILDLSKRIIRVCLETGAIVTTLPPLLVA